MGAAKPFRLLTAAELFSRPDPEWLIDRILPAGAFALLHGAEGTGKSFVALDWALTVAAGQRWHGRAVKAGHVVYVSAEGESGLMRRVRAWLRHHNLPMAAIDRAHFLPEALQVHERTDVSNLLNSMSDVPGLIVIDTLARCFVGGDENAQKEMGLFIAGVDRLRRATGATVLPVHHDTRDSGRARGSTTLPAAADTIIATTAKELPGKAGASRRVQITLTCTKQKDADPGSPIKLQLLPVEIGRDSQGVTITSCVVVTPVKGATARDLPPAGFDVETLSVLRVLFDAQQSLPRRELLDGLDPDVSPDTWDRRITELSDAGCVIKTGTARAMRLSLVKPLPLPVLLALLPDPDPIDWGRYAEVTADENELLDEVA